jgi:hypothetical protein
MKLRTVMVALSLLVAGCGRTVTPAELEAYEQHGYAGQSRGAVFKATVTALRSLGYDVVLADASSGRVKTAPKVVVVHAARTSSSTAIVAGDSVAWTVDVSGDTHGARVHAEPRLYSAGQSVPPERLNQEFADKMFSTLYSEIATNLPGQTTTTSASTPKR